MSVIDQVKERTDIVDVVSGYVALKKAGQNFKGLCPFHVEKTPSFVVFPDTQTWHCFGACGTGGDIFAFLERIEGLEFGDALKMLADRAGIELAPRSQAEIKRVETQDRLKEINATAAQYFHNLLINSSAGETARAYLLKRGIQPDEWETFQLGYALNEWDALINYLTNKRNFVLDDVAAAGLISQRRDGTGYFDRFRGRLMFPIRDISGDVVGFGARALHPDDMPKYLNSPQSSIFDKSQVLYGIDRARQTIRQADQAIIVEGYTDVIAAHTHGFSNVVASLGTALTESQLRLLKRYTKRFVLALDADTAGSQATLRGLEVAKQALDQDTVPIPTASGYIRYEARLDAEIRVLVLPAGMDPDELIREDADAWRKRVESATPVIAYVFDAQIADLDLSNPKDKSTAVSRLLPVISEIGNAIEQAHYLQRLARLVQVDERVLAEQLRRASSSRRRRPGFQHAAPQAPEYSQANARAPQDVVFGTEEFVLASLLHAPPLHASLAQAFEALDTLPLCADDFTHSANKQVYETFIEIWSAGQAADSTTMLNRLKTTLGIPFREHLESLSRHMHAEPSLSDAERNQALLEAVLRLRKHARQQEIERLRFVLETAEGRAEAERVQEQLRKRTADLLRLDRALASHGNLKAG